MDGLSVASLGAMPVGNLPAGTARRREASGLSGWRRSVRSVAEGQSRRGHSELPSHVGNGLAEDVPETFCRVTLSVQIKVEKWNLNHSTNIFGSSGSNRPKLQIPASKFPVDDCVSSREWSVKKHWVA